MSILNIVDCEKLIKCPKILQRKTDLFNQNYSIGVVAEFLMAFCLQCKERIPEKLELKNG